MHSDLAETLTAWRRHLHANPGLTLHESETAAFVAARLREMGITDIAEGVGGHGVVATLRRGGGNRSVGLRGDMDALPIQEQNEDLPWKSTIPGVMHACGHDGHTTALLGAARMLLDDPDWTGTVRLVFQPAEEGGGGARNMIADGLFERFPMERIFGWHNWPGLPAGTIAVHERAVMAAGARFEIVFDGHAGHAALPHLTRDPMVAAGHAIVAVQSIVARNLDPLQGGVVSITVVEGGEAQNQITARVTLKGTARWLRDEDGETIREGLERVAKGIAATFGVQAGFSFRQGVGVTANHPAERDLAAAAAEAVSEVRRDLPPAMTGEDFAWFLKRVPGAFVWIGNGPAEDGRELHNARYDFNDAILPVAARFLAETAKRALAGG
ncbi:amidohydrolase [Roseomonas alkaliterrae]|uniref:Hippurate hydrolase n=1 Tax=Neoroseomonas alkaliterrae TaxID=1452450 RepID=A0A840XM51_9PROT|nr:amidohydrolase [Neoroseomonas alkaliterrae]MBB5689638.1 hippurate hydrolase [Neoroseomonas alkaliterrae]MBR0677314.1 amidohydrolase [Neoroseomonas alkaliterrae]